MRRRTAGGPICAAAPGTGIGTRTPWPRRQRLRWRLARGVIAICAGLMAAAGVGAQTAAPAVSHDTPPSIMQDTGAPATFKIGDQVTVKVTFTRTVTVTGSPRIGLDIGGLRRYAAYRSGDGTLALLFGYVVMAGDRDTDGLDIVAASLERNGGTIEGVGDQAQAELSHPGQRATDARRPVDGVRPQVSLSISPTGFVHQDHLVPVLVQFSEPVTGLTAGDFEVTNGTAGALRLLPSLDPNRPLYELTLDPLAEGPLTITVPADAAHDGAGNGNALTQQRALVGAPGTVTITPSTSNTAEGQPVAFLLRRSRLNGERTVQVEVNQQGAFLSGATSFGATITTTPVTVPVIFPVGAATLELTLDTDDDYVHEDDGSVTLTVLPDPTEVGYIVGAPDTASASVRSDDAELSVLIFAAAHTPTPGAPTFAVEEGDVIRFSVVRSHDVGEHTLDLQVSQVGDFLAVAHPNGLTVPADGRIQVTIPAGYLWTEFLLSTHDDTAEEADGSITVTLLPRPADPLYPSLEPSGVILVRDDDAAVTVTVSADAASAPEGSAVSFTVARSNAPGESDRDMPVRIEVMQTGGVLASAPPATAHFAAGASSATVSVQTADDLSSGGDGSVTLRVLAPGSAATVPYLVGAPDSAVTAVLDDEPPLVSVSPVAATVTEGADAEFRFTRRGSSASELEVGVNVYGHRKTMSAATRALVENASPQPDTTVTFAAGVSEAILALTTEADRVNEGDGEITVVIGSSAAYGIAGGGSATLLVQDDDIPEATLRWISPPATLQGNVWVGEVLEGDDIEYAVDCSGNATQPALVPHAPPERIMVQHSEDLRHPDLNLTNTGVQEKNALFRHLCAGDDDGGIDYEHETKGGFKRFTATEQGDIAIDLAPQQLVGSSGFWRCYIDEIVGTPTDVRFCPKYTLGGVVSARITVINRNPTITVEAIEDEVNEGEPARFLLTRIWNDENLGLLDPADLGYTTTFDFTAAATAGYVTAALPGGSRTFGFRETEMIIEVPTEHDGAPGDDGTVTLELLPGLPATQAANVGGSYEVYDRLAGITPAGKSSRVATVTIVNTDTMPVLSRRGSRVEVEEGETLLLVVNLSGPHDRESTLDWSVQDGTATAGSDYVSAAGSLTFASGETAKTIEVSTVEDGVPEDDESVRVVFTNPVQVVLNHDTHFFVIVDDDQLPVVTITPKETPIEKTRNYTPEFVLSRQDTTDSTRLAVQMGIVQTSSDFGETAYPVVSTWIPAGDQSTTYRFRDPNYRPRGNLHYTATIVARPDDYVVGTPDSATVTVLDLNGTRRFSWEVSASPPTFDAVGDEITFTYSVYNDGNVPSGAPVTLRSRLVEDFVIAENPIEVDFTSTASRTYTVTQDDLDAEYIYEYAYAEDEFIGSTERFAYAYRTDAPVWYTIRHSANYDFDESLTDSIPGHLVNVIQHGDPSYDHAVRAYTVDETTTAGLDYTATSETLTFLEGGADRLWFWVPVVDDELDEPYETYELIVVDAEDEAQEYARGRYGIFDNDPAVVPLIHFPRTSTPLESHGDLEVAIALQHPTHDNLLRSGHTVEVSYEVVGDTAQAGVDFTRTAGRLTFAPGVQEHSIFIPIIDDSIDEPDELFDIVLFDGVHMDIPSDRERRTVRIRDNDVSTGEVALTLSPAEVSEGAGGTAITVTATSHAAARAAPTEFAVQVAGGTAGEGIDFTDVADLTLTIPAEHSTGTAVFTLTPLDDRVVEGPETVTVTATTTDPALTVTPAAGVEVRITDDDVQGVSVQPPALTIDEGQSASYSVVLNSVPAGIVTVDASLTAGAGAVTVAPASLTFSATDWDTAQQVTVTAVADADGDDAQATVGHTVAGADYGSVSAAPVAVTVRDDETASSEIELVADPTSVAESGGDRTITVTARLDAAPRAAATAVQVEIAARTATPGEDYAVVEAFEVTIAAGMVSGSATFALSPVSDEVDEEDETLSLAGEVVEGGIPVPDALPVSGGSVTITDNDTRGVLVSDAALPVEEGDSGSYTIRLTSAPTQPAAVEVEVPANADLRVAPTRLYFTRADWSTAQPVRIVAHADADTVDDTVTLTHAVTGGDYDAIAVDDVAVTITEPTWAVATVQDARALEGSGELEFEVALSRAIAVEARAHYHTVAPTASNTATAKPGDDFAAIDDAVLVFAPGETRKIITVILVDDALDEGDEHFDLQMLHAAPLLAPGQPVQIGTVQGTIEDDDPVPVLTVAGSTLGGWSYGQESAGSLAYSVRLNAPSGREVTVHYGTDDRAPAGRAAGGLQTATAAVDYVPLDGTLMFLAGETEKRLTVELNDDEVSEGDEVFALQLANPSNAVVGGEGWGVIRDEEVRGVAVMPPALTVDEGASGSYTLALTSQPTAAVTVTLTPSAGVTLGGSSLTFMTGDWATARTVTVTARHDADAVVGAATVAHSFTGGDYVGVKVADMTVTILDDDEQAVELSDAALTLAEGDRRTYTVALATQPTGAVTVTIGGTAGTDLSLDDDRLTFTTENWSVAQTVRVSAEADLDAQDDTATLDHTARGGDYGLVRKGLPVTVTDEDTPDLVLSHTALSVAEGGGAGYTVALATQPTDAVTVTIGGTAGTDLSLDDDRLSFTTANWSVAQTVRVSATADADAQDDAATLDHRAWGGDYGLVRKGLPVTVTDDDTPDLVLSHTALSVAEGGRAGYTVALATQPTGAVTVTIGGTAGTDLTLSRTVLTFTALAWNVGQTVEVTAGTDADATDDAATLSHSAAGGDYSGVADADLAVTINDHDTRGLLLTEQQMQVVEGGSNSYAASLRTAPTADVTVRMAVSGSPSVTVSPLSLTFTPTTWHIRQPVAVAVAHDPDIDNDLAVIAHRLSGGDYGAGVLEPEVTVHAIDDDEAPVLAISGPERVTEGDEVVYTVTRHGDHAPRLAVGIYVVGHEKIMSPETLARSGRNAPGVTVSFAAGAMQTSLTLTTEADNKVEGSGLLTAAIETTRSDYRVETQEADVFVYDDDVPGVSIEFLFPDDTTVVGTEVRGARTEGPPPNTFVLRCSGGYDTTGLRVNVSADVVMNHPILGYNRSAVPNPVTCDEERIDLATRRQIWTGPNNGEVRYRLEPVEESRLDWICPGDPRFCPKFTHDSPDTAVIRVINRNPTITIEADADAVTEGSPARFVLTRHWNQENLNPDVPVWGETVVALLTSEMGGYASLGDSRTATFVAGQTEMVITIPTFDDTVAGEDGELVIEILPDTTPDDLNLFGSYEIYDHIDGITAPGKNSRVARVAVLNDDDAPVVEIADASAGEQDGVLEFIVGLREGVPRSQAVTMTWATVAGTATAPDDYAAATGSAIFLPGDRTATISVAIVDDAVDEANETLAVELSGVSGAVFDGNGATLRATGTILDDDGDTTSVLSIEPLGSTRVVEGGQFVYVVRRDARLDAEITAGVHTSTNGTATAGDDYQAVDQDVTFAAGERAKILTVTVADDQLDEPEETFGIELSVAAGQPAEVAAGKDAITVTIVDDDSASMAVTLSASPASIAEGTGAVAAQSIEVTAVLDGAVAASAVTIELAVAGVSASTADFAPVTAFELVIPAHANSGTATFTITPVADAVDEEDETVAVRPGGELAAQLRVTETLVTISDDDERGVAISTTSLSLQEGGREDYTVWLTSAPTGPVDVKVEVPSRDGVGAGPPSLQFTADNWSTAQTVTVLALQDLDTTDDESKITHAVSGADYGSVVAASVTVTVDDDDTATAELTLEFGVPAHTDTDSNGDVTLGDGLSYEASARNSGNVPLINVTVSDERAGGAAQVCATLGIGESCEWSGSYQVTQADVDAGKVDNTVTATADEVADQQAGQSTPVAQKRELTLVKTAQAASFGAVGESIGYTYEVSNSGTVTLAGTVTIEDDKIESGITCDAVPVGGLGPGGTVTCTGSYTTVQADVDGSEVANTATATLAGVQSSEETERVTWISTQAGQPTVELGVGAVSVVETAGSLSFGVRLSAASEQTVTVEYETADATATAGSDYTAAAADSVLTFTAGTTVGTIEVAIADDKVDEEDETFTVRLRDPVNATLGAAATATATIVDDDARGVTVSPTELEVTEGGSDSYTVVLGSQPTGDVTVEMAVSGDEDVTVSPESLTFTDSNWATRQTVTVSADGDVDGDDDTAKITHTVSGGDYASESAEAVTVTVDDDETASATVTLSVDPASVAEEVSEHEITVTGTLDQAPRAQATAVTVSVAGDTATAAADFAVVADFELTIAAGELSGAETFTLTPVNDDVDEADETVTVSGAVADAAAGLTVAEAQVTITDNDDRGVTVTPTKLEVTEGASETYTVALTSQPTEDVTVTVTVPAGAEFTVEEAELTFAVGAWETAQTVTVKAGRDDDAVAAAAASIKHEVTGGDYGANDVAAEPVEVVIIETDTPTLSVSDARAVEASGEMVFTVTLSQALSDEVVVDYATADGTAEAGSDYSEATGKLTFAAGTTATQEIRVSIADDTVDEAEEETFTVTLSDAANATLAGGVTTLTVTGTIEDDDDPAVTVAFDRGSYTATEGGSAATVTVRLSGDPERTVEIPLTHTPGAGAVAGDYSGMTASVTFGSGDTERMLALTATDDAVDEEEETVTLGFGTLPERVTPGTQNTAILTLTDNDERGVTVSRTGLEVTEGGSESYTVVLTSEPTDEVTVAVTVPAGTDVSVDEPSLRFTNTTWTDAQTVTVRVAEDDDALADETVTLTHQVSGGDYGVNGVSAGPVAVTIVENDTPTLSVSDQRAGEASGEMVFRVTLSQASSDEVVVDYATADGTAEAGSDYSAATGKLTFAAGTTATQEIRVSIANDTVDEAEEETFTVTLSGALNAALAAGGTTLTVTGTIEDDDDPASTAVTLSVDPASVAEEGSEREITVTGTLHQAPRAQATAVTVSVAGDTATAAADFAAVADFELTIAAGEMSGTGTFTLEPVDDDVDEADETVTVSGAAPATDLSVTETQVTITDNDTRAVTVSPTELEVTEDLSGSYKVVLGSQPTNTVTVRMAVSGDDDVTVSPESLTFTTGTWAEAQTITVTAGPNVDGGGPPTKLTHQVSGADYEGMPADPVTVTIPDDDGEPGQPLTVSIAAVAATVAEGRPARFTVTRAGAMAEPLTVAVRVTERGSFIAGAPPTRVEFAAHTATATLQVPTDDDTTEEADGAVTASLAAGDGYVTVEPASATVRVTDDDAPPELTIADAHALESAGVLEFVVELSAASGRQVTMNYATAAGTATEGADYTRTVGTLTFEPGGALRHTIAVPIVNDTLDEAESETFTVAISGALNATAGAAATGTILDDDAAPELTIADVRAVESAGMMEFTVRLGAPSGRQVAVACFSEDGTATAGDDYEPELGTLVLEPGQTTGLISVPILDDRLDEADEDFTMVLSDPVNATLADGTATGTIIDDDASVAGMWLSRFGRTVATHELAAIGARLSGQSGRGAQVTIAGQRLEHGDGDGGEAAGELDLFAPSPVRTMDVPELLQGSSFLLTGTAGDESAADTGSGTAARWSAWGSGEATQFAGNDREVSLQGRVVTATVGADYERGPIVAGVAVSYSAGDGEFTVPAMDERPGRQITVDSSLVSVHPYVGVAANERLAFWGMLGYGRGRMAMDGGDVETGIEMKMGAFGASGALLVPAAGVGLGLDLKSDGFLVLMASEPTAAVPVVEADASRVRLVLAGSLGVPLGVAGVLTPSFEVGVRHDGGDAETGTGLEVGGGVRYVYPAWGLTLAANGRVLITHQNLGYDEWGAGGSLRVDPGAPGRGLALDVNSSWGTAASGVARLWALPDASELANDRAVATTVTAGRLDAEIGYGLGAGDAVVTPYAGFTLDEGGDRTYRLGSRLSLGPSFSLSLEADRRERVGVEGVAPDMGVTLNGTVRW